jgi:hypothetical protein
VVNRVFFKARDMFRFAGIRIAALLRIGSRHCRREIDSPLCELQHDGG